MGGIGQRKLKVMSTTPFLSTLFALLLPAFTFSQGEITRREARALAGRFLETLQYDQSPERQAHLLAFMDRAAQQAATESHAQLATDYAVFKIVEAAPPHVYVFAPAPIGKTWYRRLKLTLVREDGRLVLASSIKQERDETRIYFWQDEEPVEIAYTNKYLRELRRTTLRYARKTHPDAARARTNTQVPAGDWIVDQEGLYLQNGDSLPQDAGRITVHQYLEKRRLNIWSIGRPPDLGLDSFPGYWYLKGRILLEMGHRDNHYGIYLLEEMEKESMSRYSLQGGDTLRQRLVRYSPEILDRETAERMETPVDWQAIEGLDWVIPPQYDDIEFTPGAFLRVKRNDRFGILDLSGGIRLPTDYEYVTLFGADGRAAALKEGVWRWVDTTGRAVGYLGGEGADNRYSYPFMLVWQQGKTILLDSVGNLMFWSDYNYIFPLNGQVLEARKIPHSGLVRHDGTVVLPPVYDGFSPAEHEAWVYVDFQKKKGLFDTKEQKWILPPEFDQISVHSRMIEAYRVSEPAFFDLAGRPMAPPVPGALHYFGNGLFEVVREGKRGVDRRDGRTVIPPLYDEVKILDEMPLFAVSRDGLWGLFDTLGREILPPRYDWLRPCGSSRYGSSGVFVIFSQNREEGLLDSLGNELLPAVYNHIGSYDAEADRLPVGKQGKYGLIDRKGREALPPKYDLLIGNHEIGFVVKQDDKHGLVDANGAQVLPLDFDELRSLTDHWRDPYNPVEGFLLARVGSLWGMLRIPK
jgi:hypothetical protein